MLLYCKHTLRHTSWATSFYESVVENGKRKETKLSLLFKSAQIVSLAGQQSIKKVFHSKSSGWRHLLWNDGLIIQQSAAKLDKMEQELPWNPGRNWPNFIHPLRERCLFPQMFYLEAFEWGLHCGSGVGLAFLFSFCDLFSFYCLSVRLSVCLSDCLSVFLSVPPPFPPVIFAIFSFNICCSCRPRYNRTGWLGIKHQLTYLLAVRALFLSVSLLFLSASLYVTKTCI